MKVLVLGWSNYGNIGDEAYKIAFPLLFPEADFTFTNNMAKHNAEDYDQIILGGGDILSDLYLDQVQKLNKPVTAISVNGNRYIDTNKIKTLSHIYVRDRETIDHMSKFAPVTFSPDVTFMMQPQIENGRQLIAKYFQNREQYSKTVAVVINAHLFSDFNRKATSSDQVTFIKFAYDLSWMMDNSPYSFLFVPFSTGMPWDDRASNAFVACRSKFWRKNALVYDVLTPNETLDIISACDGCISTRLHSSIFSTIAKVPFLDITHNHKNKWFLETINYKHSIPYKNIEPDAVKQKLDSVLANRKRISEVLGRITENQRLQLKEISNVLAYK